MCVPKQTFSIVLCVIWIKATVWTPGENPNIKLDGISEREFDFALEVQAKQPHSSEQFIFMEETQKPEGQHLDENLMDPSWV